MTSISPATQISAEHLLYTTVGYPLYVETHKNFNRPHLMMDIIVLRSAEPSIFRTRFAPSESSEQFPEAIFTYHDEIKGLAREVGRSLQLDFGTYFNAIMLSERKDLLNTPEGIEKVFNMSDMIGPVFLNILEVERLDVFTEHIHKSNLEMHCHISFNGVVLEPITQIFDGDSIYSELGVIDDMEKKANEVIEKINSGEITF